MRPKTNTISFIIVNYKSEFELNKCLSDLSRIDNASNCEIIVVNNDKNKLSLPQYPFATQKVYEINKNIGYGRANNIGLTYATSDFVCFLNPDTHSFCQNFTNIIDYITDENTIVSPQIRTDNGSIEKWSVGENITLSTILKNHLGYNKHLELSRKDIFVDWVSGATMIAPRTLLNKLGGFDEDFFLYYEDVDLCKRVTNMGGKIKYVPQFYLTHTNGVSSKNDVQKQKKCYYTSQDLFFSKHCGILQSKILRFCRLFYSK